MQLRKSTPAGIPTKAHLSLPVVVHVYAWEYAILDACICLGVAHWEAKVLSCLQKDRQGRAPQWSNCSLQADLDANYTLAHKRMQEALQKESKKAGEKVKAAEWDVARTRNKQ